MFLKLMSSEDLPDDDPRKSYKLIERVSEFYFDRNFDGAAFVEYICDRGDRTTTPLEGNVYVLNDIGHVIDSFGIANPYGEHDFAEDNEPWPNNGNPFDFPTGIPGHPGNLDPFPYGPSGGPIPGESPCIFAGFTNLDHEAKLYASTETDYATKPQESAFEVMRVPDKADVVIRGTETGAGVVIDGEAGIKRMQHGDQEEVMDTYEALTENPQLAEQIFKAAANYDGLTPADQVDDLLSGGKISETQRINGAVKAIREASHDEPILRQIVHQATDAHFWSLVHTGMTCAVMAYGSRDPETGQGIDGSIKPDVVKATGQPNHIGKARLSELCGFLEEYLRTGDNISREGLAISALRLYAWEDKVIYTDESGGYAMASLVRVCEAILAA